MGGLAGGLLGVVGFVAVILIVILIHESGHFFLAKLSGIRVDEFAFGFGPQIMAHRRGETIYSLRAIPAGGFVRMAGMLGLESEADAGDRNFYRAPIPKRMAVIAAGIIFNFVLGALCTAVIAFAGNDSMVPAGQASYHAGLRDGDRILSADGQPLDLQSAKTIHDGLTSATIRSQGRPIRIVYKSAAGATRTTAFAPELVIENAAQPDAQHRLPVGLLIVHDIDGQPVGIGDPRVLLAGPHRISGVVAGGAGAGTSFSNVAISGVATGITAAPGLVVASWRVGYAPGNPGASVPAALADGAVAIPTFIHDTVAGIYHLVTTPTAGGLTGPEGLSGPIGIAFASGSAVQHGWLSFLGFIATLSFSVGLLNVLPIPFLDGGRLGFILLEAVRRRRLEPRREAAIYAAGLALLVVWTVYVTIGDIRKIPDFLR